MLDQMYSKECKYGRLLMIGLEKNFYDQINLNLIYSGFDLSKVTKFS